MTLQQQYQFYLTLPTGEEVQFYPCNDVLQWSEKPYKDESFFRLELDTALVFDKSNYFNEMFKADQDRCTCNAWPIRITERCNPKEPYEHKFTGTLNFVDGAWNPDECTVSIKPRPLDAYSKMLRNWQKGKNFLEIQERVNAGSYFGELVCQTLTNTNQPSGFGWVLKNDLTVKRDGIVISTIKTWCRLESLLAPPDTFGWQLEGGKWVSAPNLVNCVDIDRIDDGDPDGSGGFINVITETGFDCQILDFQSDGGITLKSLLEFYLSDCFDNICSNFFNINPDGTNPDNDEYRNAAIDYSNVVAFQTFDIVNPTGNAFIFGGDNQVAGIKKWKDLWDDLKLLNLCMVYDKDSNCLRIEHITYFISSGPVFDLLNSQFINCIDDNSYTTEPIDIPRFEHLRYKFDTGQRDFNEGSIEYDEQCSDPDEDTNVRLSENTFNCMLNDIASIYNVEKYFEDTNVIDNITLVSTDANGTIQSTVGPITGDLVLNGAWSTAHIITKYWRHNRPQCGGFVNGSDNYSVFASTRPTRKHKDVTIEIPTVTHNAISPASRRVRTNHGYAYIQELKRKAPYNETTFVLKF